MVLLCGGGESSVSAKRGEGQEKRSASARASPAPAAGRRSHSRDSQQSPQRSCVSTPDKPSAASPVCAAAAVEEDGAATTASLATRGEPSSRKDSHGPHEPTAEKAATAPRNPPVPLADPSPSPGTASPKLSSRARDLSASHTSHFGSCSGSPLSPETSSSAFSTAHDGRQGSTRRPRQSFAAPAPARGQSLAMRDVCLTPPAEPALCGDGGQRPPSRLAEGGGRGRSTTSLRGSPSLQQMQRDTTACALPTLMLSPQKERTAPQLTRGHGTDLHSPLDGRTPQTLCAPSEFTASPRSCTPTGKDVKAGAGTRNSERSDDPTPACAERQSPLGSVKRAPKVDGLLPVVGEPSTSAGADHPSPASDERGRVRGGALTPGACSDPSGGCPGDGEKHSVYPPLTLPEGDGSLQSVRAVSEGDRRDDIGALPSGSIGLSTSGSPQQLSSRSLPVLSSPSAGLHSPRPMPPAHVPVVMDTHIASALQRGGADVSTAFVPRTRGSSAANGLLPMGDGCVSPSIRCCTPPRSPVLQPALVTHPSSATAVSGHRSTRTERSWTSSEASPGHPTRPSSGLRIAASREGPLTSPHAAPPGSPLGARVRSAEPEGASPTMSAGALADGGRSGSLGAARTIVTFSPYASPEMTDLTPTCAPIFPGEEYSEPPAGFTSPKPPQSSILQRRSSLRSTESSSLDNFRTRSTSGFRKSAFAEEEQEQSFLRMTALVARMKHGARPSSATSLTPPPQSYHPASHQGLPFPPSSRLGVPVSADTSFCSNTSCSLPATPIGAATVTPTGDAVRRSSFDDRSPCDSSSSIDDYSAILHSYVMPQCIATQQTVDAVQDAPSLESRSTPPSWDGQYRRRSAAGSSSTPSTVARPPSSRKVSIVTETFSPRRRSRADVSFLGQ